MNYTDVIETKDFILKSFDKTNMSIRKLCIELNICIQCSCLTRKYYTSRYFDNRHVLSRSDKEKNFITASEKQEIFLYLTFDLAFAI